MLIFENNLIQACCLHHGGVGQEWKKSKGNHLVLCSGPALRCNYFKAERSFELCVINSGKQSQGVFIKCSILAWTNYQTNVIWPTRIDPLEDQAIQAANSLCFNNEPILLWTLQGFTFQSHRRPSNPRMFFLEEILLSFCLDCKS